MSGTRLPDSFDTPRAKSSSAGDIDYHQDKPGIPGVCEANDRFGTSLSAGDIGTDGKADIAIGIPYEKVGSIVDAGWVLVIHSTGSYQSINQGSPGVIGALETGDRFGQQVLLVDFTDDDSADSSDAPLLLRASSLPIIIVSRCCAC